MNTEPMPKIVHLDDNELHELTMEIKETLANDMLYPEKVKENFTTLDMWNVLRQTRSASSMLRRWSN